VISSFRVFVSNVFRLLERNAVLIGSHRRFETASHSNGRVNWFEPYWVPLNLGLSSGTLRPLVLKSKSWHFCPFMKNQFHSRAVFLTSSGSKENEPRSWCLSVTKASYVRITWTEVSFCAPQLLHRGVSVSHIMQRCLFMALHPVRWPVYNHPNFASIEEKHHRESSRTDTSQYSKWML